MQQHLLFAALLAICAPSALSVCPRAQSADLLQMSKDARAVLDGNWVPSMNSTLPSPNLYPHQWSWDASFVAMGYSHYDTQKAVDETDALFRGQWRNGLLPHIVFNPSAVESYFPGPDFWKIDTAKENGPATAHTSGIIQPPVHALASLAIYDNAPPASRHIALAHLEDVYPKLVAWHDYLYNDRDPLNRGLVFIRHMWESGMDNSPAWDPVLADMNLQEGDVPHYVRVDKGKVGDHKERPNTFFYDRAVHLIKVFYDNEYDEKRIFEKSPFVIEDVLFNSILARAGVALARIATILGKTEEAAAHTRNSEWTAAAITEHLYNKEDGFFYDYNMVKKQQIRTKISGGLVGVLGAKMDKDMVNTIVKELYTPGFLGEDLSAWTIPSVSRDDPGYTNTTYWKGPAWININYLVRDGLLRNAGNNKDAMRIAAYLKERSLELMRMSGFYEYFNPISGSPHGGHEFSWSAALAIDWICSADEQVVASNKWRSAFVWAAYLALAIASVALTLRIARNKVPEPQANSVVNEQAEAEVRALAAKAGVGLDDKYGVRTTARLRSRTHTGGDRRRA